MMPQHFGYAIDKRYLPLLLPFGLRPARDGVTLTDDGSFMATFGFFKLATPVANITGAHITRDYRWWTAFGVRGSMADDGLSFGTNHDAGVCVHFADKVPSPLRRSGHSALTVTVADLEGLTAALGSDDAEPARDTLCLSQRLGVPTKKGLGPGPLGPGARMPRAGLAFFHTELGANGRSATPRCPGHPGGGDVPSSQRRVD